MFELIGNILEYAFIQRALLAGSFVGITCAILGFFLILRRFSLIGDGLAHTGFATVAIGLLLGISPIYISIPLVMAASIMILKLAEKTTMYGDSAIGLVSSLSIALGIIISTLAGGFNVDLFSYLFGSILAISPGEVIISIVMSLAVILLIVFFYSELFATTYDEDFARVSGIKTKMINYLLILITAVTVVLGIRVVGTMLISSLIIFPAVSALQVARGFKFGIILSAVFALVSVIIGIFVSFFLNISTGATIVVINALIFAGSFIFKKAVLQD